MRVYQSLPPFRQHELEEPSLSRGQGSVITVYSFTGS